MVGNIDLGMLYRNDELSNGETGSTDPHVYLLETGIGHGGGEILQRYAITDAAYRSLGQAGGATKNGGPGTRVMYASMMMRVSPM